MSEDHPRGDAPAPGDPASDRPASDPAAPPSDVGQQMREQEAIAAAMMLSEQMRREDRGTTYFYVKRIGLSVSALSLAGMIMLLAYTQLTRGEFNPTPGMVFLAFFTAAGATAWYWARAESKRSDED